MCVANKRVFFAVINILKPLIKQFMPFAQERIGFDHPPKLFLRQDTQNADNPLGKTAYYDFQAKSVTLYITGRHPKDIMRSLAHELVHHKQNCDGQFENIGEMGEGYAQTNPHLRQMEIAANRDGSMCLRDWEDSIKGTIYNEHLLKGVNNTMSTKTWKNKELTTLLSEAWGFGFDLDTLNEGTPDVGDPKTIKGDEEGETGELERGLKQEAEEEQLEEKEGYKQRLSQHLGKNPGKGDASKKEREAESEGEEEKQGKGKFSGDPEMSEVKLNEDSGEDEAWHDWKNEHADDDHIREIEHHLRALKGDRDYERHGAEYDHDKYEDEGDPVDEGGSGRPDPTRLQGRDSARDLPDRKRPMEEQAIRRMVRQTIRKIYQENKK